MDKVQSLNVFVSGWATALDGNVFGHDCKSKRSGLQRYGRCYTRMVTVRMEIININNHIVLLYCVDYV